MDLSTTYMGLNLSSPLIAGAGPLGQDLDTVKKLAEAGAGALVLWSLFEEQIEHEARELDYYFHQGAERFAESITYFPEEDDFKLGPEEYLKHIEQAKAATDMPVIASLNGISVGGWIDHAKQIQQAGADAIELNVYYIPTDPTVDAGRVEQVYLDVLAAVKENLSIPVAMKLSPYFSATAHMANRLDEAGADALVLFNRFYQPDIDLIELEVTPNLKLSSRTENRLPLRWAAILYGQLQADIATTSGCHTGEDMVKLVMAGATATQMVSALLVNGPEYAAEAIGEFRTIASEKGYESVQQMRGILSQKNCAEPAAFERANYMKTLQSFSDQATLE